MFGLFKRKNYTKELLAMLLLQSDIMKELLYLLQLRHGNKKDQKMIPEKICGEWICKDIGISIKIIKKKNSYCVHLNNLDGLSEDFQEPYIIRMHKGICYFILNGYAIFIDYDEEENKIYLEGNLVLTNKESPIEGFMEKFNPN